MTRPGIRDHSSFTASTSLPTGASVTSAGGIDASTSGSTTPSSQPSVDFSVAAIAAMRAASAVSKASSSSAGSSDDAPMSRMRRATASFTCG